MITKLAPAIDFNPKKIKDLEAAEAHYDQVLTGYPELRDAETDELIAVVKPFAYPPLRSRILEAKLSYQGARKRKGLLIRNQSEIFGWTNPSFFKQFNKVMAPSTIMRKHPHLADQLRQSARIANNFYAAEAPVSYQNHFNCMTDFSRNELGLAPGCVFNQGVINRDNVLPMHTDRNNFPGAWSVMVTLKKDIAGGLLVFPRFRAALDLPDSSMILFNGQAEWHGVTAIKRLKPISYRITVVFYSNENICSIPSWDFVRQQAEQKLSREINKKNG